MTTDACLLLKVTGLMTQGRADGQEWVTSFLVSYSLDSINWYYIVDQYDNKLVRPHALDGVQIPPPSEGEFLGKGAPIVKYRDFLPWAVQNGWTDRFAVWVLDSVWSKKAKFESYSPASVLASSSSNECSNSTRRQRLRRLQRSRLELSARRTPSFVTDCCNVCQTLEHSLVLVLEP